MTRISIQKFRGGLNLTEATNLKDDELDEATNMYYDSSKRLITRRGKSTFGQPIPDSIVLIDYCDATTNWAVAGDGANLATGTALFGSNAAGTISVNSISFDIDVSVDPGNQTTLTKTIASPVNISNTKGYIGFTIKPPSGFNTNLTSVKVRLGTDASNYYEWTLGTLTEASINHVILLFSDASTTGTINDASIAHFRILVDYSASYTDKTGVLVDNIYAYSATSTKPATSYFFHQRDDTFQNLTIVSCGTNLLTYDEDSGYWVAVWLGVTEYETATGQTDKRTRWDFMVYKNVIYMCNGVDEYRSWDGTKVIVYNSSNGYLDQPKFRYLQYLDDQDRCSGAGADTAPSTFYYTGAAPVDAQNPADNSLVVGGDQLGRINGILNIGSNYLVGKDRKIYAIDITNTSVDPIDAQNGWYSNRAIRIVGNGLMYFNERGIDTLKARDGISGAGAIETLPYSANIWPTLKDITPNQYNANCGIYIRPLQNYYFCYDSDDDNIPDSIVVYSALIAEEGRIAWSKYLLGNFYDFGEYIDSSNNLHFLGASADSGQMYEIEYGFTDNGVAINHIVRTKEWDNDEPESWKDFQFVDIFGIASEGINLNITTYVDGESVADVFMDDTYLDFNSVFTTIGTSAIGVSTIGGGSSSEEIPLYQYKIRIPIYAGGSKLQVKLESETPGNVWSLDKISLQLQENAFDIFPTANIS